MEIQAHYQQTVNVLNRSWKYGYFKISKHSVLKYWYISVFPPLFLEYAYKDWIFESFQELLCWVISNIGAQVSISVRLGWVISEYRPVRKESGGTGR